MHGMLTVTDRIKFEGDGVPVGANTSFCLMNVAVLDGNDIFRTNGRESLACVTGAESYELWQVCFAAPIAWANELDALKKITVDGEEYDVEVFVGGDYKFLLTVLGLNAAMASYACAYCYVHSVSIATA